MVCEPPCEVQGDLPLPAVVLQLRWKKGNCFVPFRVIQRCWKGTPQSWCHVTTLHQGSFPEQGTIPPSLKARVPLAAMALGALKSSEGNTQQITGLRLAIAVHLGPLRRSVSVHGCSGGGSRRAGKARTAERAPGLCLPGPLCPAANRRRRSALRLPRILLVVVLVSLPCPRAAGFLDKTRLSICL